MQTSGFHVGFQSVLLISTHCTLCITDAQNIYQSKSEGCGFKSSSMHGTQWRKTKIIDNLIRLSYIIEVFVLLLINVVLTVAGKHSILFVMCSKESTKIRPAYKFFLQYLILFCASAAGKKSSSQDKHSSPDWSVPFGKENTDQEAASSSQSLVHILLPFQIIFYLCFYTFLLLTRQFNPVLVLQYSQFKYTKLHLFPTVANVKCFKLNYISQKKIQRRITVIANTEL